MKRENVWLALAGLAALVAVAMILSDSTSGSRPTATDDEQSLVPPIPRDTAVAERPIATKPVFAPQRNLSSDPEERSRQARLARDPKRIDTAEQALGGFEHLLLDIGPIENVAPGEIRGGMAPAPLLQRNVAVAFIETVIAQPENEGPIREQAMGVFESLLQEPWPTPGSPEADQFVLVERGRALASLAVVDPQRAAKIYRVIPTAGQPERVAKRATHVLVSNGMAKEEARARINAILND